MPRKNKKETAKTSNKKTHVAIVLDRSGSMSSVKKQTIEGLNKQLATLQKSEELLGDIDVTLIQFDSTTEISFRGKRPSELKEFSDDDYRIGSYTAMYDGIWAAITELKTLEETEDTSYLVVVLSDGEENASREVTHEVLAEEIKRLQDKGNWQFNYILANIDIKAVSNTLHAKAGNVIAYNSTAKGTSATFDTMAESLVSYTNTRSVTMSNLMGTTVTGFTQEQQDKLKDIK